MELLVTVETSQITNLNGSRNEAVITVLLDELWDKITNRYTHLYMESSIKIPVLENQLIEISITREFAVNEIVDKKVSFTVEYEGEDDKARKPSGTATLTGYQKVMST